MRLIRIAALATLVLGCATASMADTGTPVTTSPSTTTTTHGMGGDRTPTGFVVPLAPSTLPTQVVTHGPRPMPPTATRPSELSITPVQSCAGGGTRTTSGTYDRDTGAVNLVVTMSDCVDPNHTTHNGTVSITGSVVVSTATTTATASTSAGTPTAATTPARTAAIDLVYVFDTHFVSERSDIQRQCTWKKVGTLDYVVEKFSGTITKTNCVLTVYDYERGDILEHFLRKAQSSE